jgi:hypothetical protein
MAIRALGAQRRRCLMNGLSDNDAVNSILWPDSELERVCLDYDSVHIAVKEEGSVRRTLVCSGYIGVEVVGLWDEMVIEDAKLIDTHPRIDKCHAELKQRLGNAANADTGSASRNSRKWKLLRIVFSDGLEMNVVASKFSVL